MSKLYYNNSNLMVNEQIEFAKYTNKLRKDIKHITNTNFGQITKEQYLELINIFKNCNFKISNDYENHYVIFNNKNDVIDTFYLIEELEK